MVCSVVLLLDTGLLRLTRPGLAIVGVCRRPPPGLKPHAHRGEDAGLRARGLWCFERVIRVANRDRVENLAGGRAWWSLMRLIAATFWLMGAETAPLQQDRSPRRPREAPRTEWAFLHSAVHCPNGLPGDPSMGSGFGRSSAWRTVATSSTGGGRLNSKLGNANRGGDDEGLTGSREPCRTRQFAGEARLIAWA